MFLLNKPSELENIIGIFEDITIIGNGPSLKSTPKDFFIGKTLIGMNRIDSFILQNDLYLKVYIFVTDNIENKNWGEDWFNSLFICSERSEFTLISKEVYKYLLESDSAQSKVILSRNIIVINCLKEPKLYSKNAVIYPDEYYTKSGTSLNLASQIALSIGVKNIEYCGVDLGWKTTSKSKQNDPNHYSSSYFARIKSGYIENCRMHHVHDRLSILYKNKGISVKNFSPLSIVEVYDNFDFNDNVIFYGVFSKGSFFKRQLVSIYSELKNELLRIILRVLKLLKVK
ncbi:hypothetical protein M1D72_20975 [Vibrio sp. AK197]